MMQRLYPNFYSLVSAPSHPLDPHVRNRHRRRSFVWSPSVSRDLTALSEISDSGEPDMPNRDNSQSIIKNKTHKNGVRKRSASQVAVRQPLFSTQMPFKKSNQIEILKVRKNSLDISGAASPGSSRASTSPPPPPPPGFGDEPSEMGVSNQPNPEPSPILKSSTPPPWDSTFYTVTSARDVYPVYHIPGADGIQTFESIQPPGHPHYLHHQQAMATYVPEWTPIVRRNPDLGAYHGGIHSAYSNAAHRPGYCAPIHSYLIPVRMQTALSLQSLDKLCINPTPAPIVNAPSVTSVHSGPVPRPKLVMGLRDLSCSGRGPSSRKPDWSASQQSTSRSSVRPELNAPISVLAPPSPGSGMFHTRINSYPSAGLNDTGSTLVQYMIPCDENPVTGRLLRRTPDNNRRARLTDRRRTVWDPIPTYRNEALAIPCLAEPNLSSVGVVHNPRPSGFAIQPSKVDVVVSGLHSLSSDSGVELAEFEVTKKAGVSSRPGRDAKPVAAVSGDQDASAITGSAASGPRKRKVVNTHRVSYVHGHTHRHTRTRRSNSVLSVYKLFMLLHRMENLLTHIAYQSDIQQNLRLVKNSYRHFLSIYYAGFFFEF